MSEKTTYVKKLQAQLDEWGAEIDKLKARAGRESADAQQLYQEKLEELTEKREAAVQKLGELRQASDDAWEDLKYGTETAWKSLSAAVKSAVDQFK